MTWWHTQVNGPLMYGYGRLLDDDGLGVDHRWALVPYVYAAIKAGLGHADADTNLR